MKTFLLTLAKIVISIGLILWTTYHFDWTAVLHDWSEADVFFLFCSFTVLSLSYIIGAFQWQLILKTGGIVIPYKKILGFYYVGLFFNNFLISGMGGDVMRIYDIHRHGEDKERLSPAIAAVFLDRLTGLMTLIFFAGIAGVFLVGQGESKKMLFMIIGLLAIWVIGFIILFNREVAIRMIKPFFKKMPAVIYTKLQHLYDEVNKFKSEPKTTS